MLITNATLITWGSPNQILEDHALYIDNDRIRDVGPTTKLKTKYPEADTLDARGQIVMPGGICAHTHFMALSRVVWLFPAMPPKTSPIF